MSRLGKTTWVFLAVWVLLGGVVIFLGTIFDWWGFIDCIPHACWGDG